MHDIHSGQFIISSGRTIILTELKMTHTYAGILEGSPETLARYIRKGLEEAVQKSLLSGLPLVIVGADVTEFPKYKWEAEFFSPRGVHTSDSDYSSQLALCWFSEDIPRDLPATIEKILLTLDWETLAQDYDNMP